MEFEVLKRSHLKRNMVIVLVVVAIISAIVLNFTQAKYKLTESIPIVNGTVNYKRPDLNVVAMYQQDESGEYVNIDTVPTSGYALNTELSVCGQSVDGEIVKDESIPITYENGRVYIGINTKGTKCYLYFDEQKGPLLNETILTGKDIQERLDFSTVLSTNTNGIIYRETTDEGTTYYFAGDTDENWVSYAGHYWRVIRINEDGSIRMIYNGTTTDQTGSTTQCTTSTFDSSYNNNMYVGYMYTSNQVHGLGTDSTIKGVIDGWYEVNILDTEYEQYVSTEAGFCGDRMPYSRSGSSGSYTYTSGGGTGSTETYYGAYTRLNTNNAADVNPTLECTNSSDLYTVAESSQGNHALDYPIGLITADEAAYAGGVYSTNNSGYYLYTNSTYWTMSPYSFNGSFAGVFRVGGNGRLGYIVDDTYGVRPVINLRSDVTVSSGDGTSNNPYQI